MYLRYEKGPNLNLPPPQPKPLLLATPLSSLNYDKTSAAHRNNSFKVFAYNAKIIEIAIITIGVSDSIELIYTNSKWQYFCYENSLNLEIYIPCFRDKP